MPLYEYRCQSCSQVFEVIQKFADAPLTVHEACGGEVERLISASAFQFKGSGWYVTDYAKSKGANGTNSGSPESKSEGKTETKSDSGSKSETKSETKSESTPAPASTKSDK